MAADPEGADAESRTPLAAPEIGSADVETPCAVAGGEARGLTRTRALLGFAVVGLGVVGVLLCTRGARVTAAPALPEDWQLYEFSTQEGSYLSKTWRMDPKQPYLVAPAKKIFDESSEDVSFTSFAKMSVDVITTTSSGDFGKRIAANLGLEGSYGWPTSGFTAVAEASLESVSHSTYDQFRMDRMTKYISGKIGVNYFDPPSKLHPLAKRFLLNAPVKEVHNTLGDFYSQEVWLGGICQTTMTTDMRSGDTEVKVKAELEAQYETLAASAKGSMTDSVSTESTVNQRYVTVKMAAVGGDTSIWMQLTQSNGAEVQARWADSVNQDNEFPVGFHLVPIWELLNHDDMDRKKARELKEFMLDHWERAAARVPQHQPQEKQGELEKQGEKQAEKQGKQGNEGKQAHFWKDIREAHFWKEGSNIATLDQGLPWRLGLLSVLLILCCCLGLLFGALLRRHPLCDAHDALAGCGAEGGSTSSTGPPSTRSTPNKGIMMKPGPYVPIEEEPEPDGLRLDFEHRSAIHTVYAKRRPLGIKHNFVAPIVVHDFSINSYAKLELGIKEGWKLRRIGKEELNDNENFWEVNEKLSEHMKDFEVWPLPIDFRKSLGSSEVVTVVFRQRPIGINFSNRSPVTVDEVYADSPAKAASVEQGWYITRIGEVDVLQNSHFREVMKLFKEGVQPLPEGGSGAALNQK